MYPKPCQCVISWALCYAVHVQAECGWHAGCARKGWCCWHYSREENAQLPLSLSILKSTKKKGLILLLKDSKNEFIQVVMNSQNQKYLCSTRKHNIEHTSPRGWWRTEQVAQGGCGCPIPAGIQGQAGCGSGQPGLVVGNPAHSRGVETRWALWSFSTQAILWFYDTTHELGLFMNQLLKIPLF